MERWESEAPCGYCGEDMAPLDWGLRGCQLCGTLCCDGCYDWHMQWHTERGDGEGETP